MIGITIIELTIIRYLQRTKNEFSFQHFQSKFETRVYLITWSHLPKNTLVNVSIWDNFVGNNIEAYLRPYKTFMQDYFCENSKKLKDVNKFCKKKSDVCRCSSK